MCRKRARLWSLPDDGFYKQYFVWAHDSCNTSWSSLSLQIMKEWRIPDFPDGPSQRSYRSYVQFVKAHLSDICSSATAASRAKPRAPVTYDAIQEGPCALYRAVLRANMGWDSLSYTISWARLRTGGIPMSHVNKKASNARTQFCICCGATVGANLKHAILLCPCFRVHRAACAPVLEQDGEKVSNFLRLTPASQCFPAALAFAAALDRASRDFFG